MNQIYQYLLIQPCALQMQVLELSIMPNHIAQLHLYLCRVILNLSALQSPLHLQQLFNRFCSCKLLFRLKFTFNPSIHLVNQVIPTNVYNP